MLSLMEISGIIGVVLLNCSWVPQIYRLLSRKSSEDVSVKMFVIAVFGFVFLQVYTIIGLGDALYIIGNQIGLTFSCIGIILTLKYRREANGNKG